MKKNVLAMGLALTMALGLTACGSSSNGSASSGAASGSASQNDASASAPAVDKLVLGTSADYPLRVPCPSGRRGQDCGHRRVPGRADR